MNPKKKHNNRQHNAAAQLDSQQFVGHLGVQRARAMYESFKQMPGILKFITAHALACFLFLIMVLIPGMTITYNGEPMTPSELWAQGLALPILFISLSMPAVGVLFMKRSKYARQIYSVLLLLAMVAPYIYWQEFISMLFGVVISAVIIGYLFINSDVRTYFSS